MTTEPAPPPDQQVQRDPKTGRFVKGVSGNPHGRPKGMTLTEVLREHIDPDALAKALLKRLSKDDLDAIKYIYDRIDGRPRQAVEHSGKDGAPIALTWDDGSPA